MEKKHGGAVTFPISKPGRKRKRVYIFSRGAIIFAASVFKITVTLILQSLPLRCSCCYNRTQQVRQDNTINEESCV